MTAAEEKALRIHVTRLVGAAVVGADDERLGTISDIMVDAKVGAIAYVAIAVGGVLSVGERLFAVPWGSLKVPSGNGPVRLTLSAAYFEDRSGFDKDAWPSDADSALRVTE